MNRREFLLGSLSSIVFVACGSSGDGDGGSPSGPDDSPSDPGRTEPPLPRPIPTSSPEASDRAFPQGLLSGDPRPDRVLLWTRAAPELVGLPATAPVEVTLIVARDEALRDIVAQTKLLATPEADHTVRVVATGLDADRYYYYRFDAGGITTRIGRTKTAPSPESDRPVRFAFCSCQDFIGRRYHSWQALLEGTAELDFVMWLGDYIYETVNDPRFQSTSPDRAIQLPDGIDTSAAQDGSRIAAATLADYRALYKVYRSDPLLREVHRRFPFITTWDDHEFADDCWQDHATSFNELDPKTKGFTDEKNTARRMAANRAFFEYQPIDVSYLDGATFPNDITIYRSLRYGKNVEIFVTDQRSYRDDHLVPEGPIDVAVGKPTRNTIVGSRYFVRKSAFDTREERAKPTLLGATQKAWLIDGVTRSSARWKVWANEVQLWQMTLRLGDLPSVPGIFSYTVYVNADQWDGFRSERAEILGAFQRASVENLLVCTGDIHAFFASELYVDFDGPRTQPVGVEFVTAGISSASLDALVGNVVAEESALRPVADYLVNGADGSLRASNPHLKLADTRAYGFAIVDVDAQRAEVTFVEVGDPREPTYPGVKLRRTLRTAIGSNRIEVV